MLEIGIKLEDSLLLSHPKQVRANEEPLFFWNWSKRLTLNDTKIEDVITEHKKKTMVVHYT